MQIKVSTVREKYSLTKSETLFNALFQHSADIFFLVDSDLSINYVNDAITRILGYYPEEVIGKSISELVHQQEQPIINTWLQKLSSNDSTIPVEIRIKSLIGNWQYIEVSGTNMLQHEPINALVITCKDIQVKKMADEALMLTEQRLSLLLNNTKESFIILDSSLRVMSYNKAAQEHSPFFFRQELQSGLSFFELIEPSQENEYVSILEKTVTGEEYKKDTEFQDAKGELHIYCHVFRRLDLGDLGSGIFITSANITEQRKAEKALKESEEKFKAIIKNSFDALVIIDENAIVQYASPSVTNLIGFEPEELVGKSGFEFIYPDDLPYVEEKLASIIKNHDETYADYRSITKNGGLKWLEAKGKNMFDNKHIGGILVSFRDITERKKMFEEQNALTNELTKYNKDLQQFSFITSHNLRAPVANLMSLLTLFNKEKMDDVFNIELLNKFEECTYQLNDTLNDLINVLVIRANPNSDTEYVRFADVAESTLRNVQSLLRDTGGELLTDFSAVDGTEYNKIHIESIFLNLVSNAIKYASTERKLKIRISSEKTSEGVRLIFSDNGIGIDLNRYGDRIFGLYQRFHSGKQGKGLGLYMIKSQIIASGGSIKVESEPNKGTSFFIHLKSHDIR